jgi:general secretion pathway protein A
MYNNYFHFSESPFENNHNQKFLFMSTDHKEVLASLFYFIEQKKGIAMVCGDVGTGKTMIVNSFLERLPEYVHPIVIQVPIVSYQELLLFIAETLKIQRTTGSLFGLIDEVKKALMIANSKGITYVIIFDEAHLLPDSSLEEIRLLSNIETSRGKLLQIILVGQYELSHQVNRLEMRQLRQRININRSLSPLDANETIRYINYRLKIVGSDFNACFENNCRELIFKMTNGIPRLINRLCDMALLICMNDGATKVNRHTLKRAAEGLETDLMLVPGALRRSTWYRGWDLDKVLVYMAGLLIIFFCAVLSPIFFAWWQKPTIEASQDILAMVSADLSQKPKGENSRTYIETGTVHYAMGQFSQAIAAFTKALKLDPKNADALLYRGRSYLQNGDYDQAIADFDGILKRGVREGEAYAVRGTAYYAKAQYDQAIGDFSKVLKIYRNIADSRLILQFTESYLQRGRDRLSNRQFDEAIEDFTRAAELDPSFAVAYYERGLANYQRKYYKSALRDLAVAQNLGYIVPRKLVSRIEREGNLEWKDFSGTHLKPKKKRLD